MADGEEATQVLRTVEERLASTDPRVALAEHPGPGAKDPLAIPARLGAAWILRELGRLADARESCAQAISLARGAGDPTWIARGVATASWIRWDEGDRAGAVQLARRARAEAPEDPTARDLAGWVLAAQARRAGDLRAALGHLAGPAGGEPAGSPWIGALRCVERVGLLARVGSTEEARALHASVLAATPSERRVARAWLAVAGAGLARAAGDHHRAWQAVDEALEDLGPLRVSAAAELHLARAEDLRRLGDLAGSLAAHGRALEILDALDHPRRHAARMSLVLVALQDDQPDLARRALAAVVRAAVPEEELAAVDAAVAAAGGDLRAWALHHERARAFLAGHRRATEEQARALDLAADRWESSGSPHRHRAAFRSRALALGPWELLGRAERAAATLRKLRASAGDQVPLPAGPFDLQRVLGAGAMGDVWLGHHHVQGHPVAVKVLRLDTTHDEFLRRSFDAEIRAVAALGHPGIVQIVGHGVLDAASAQAHDARLAGSPWFAMEFVQGGTLEEVCGRSPWASSRALLRGLLEAVGHAHARGVLHLDIKPANVLLDGGGEGGSRPRLGDFGLTGLAGDGRRAAGTPQYMAPEQFRGRELGPWTDLYAVGCLAWTLVTGAPPFDGTDPRALRAAHARSPLPPLRPATQVPEGLEEWLAWLLEKDPARRPPSAAHAAWALLRLTDRATEGEPTQAAGAGGPPPDAPAPGGETVEGKGAVGLRSARPPMPVSWTATPLERPRGVQALDLFPLRRLPFVGRTRQRDLLWATLADVRRRAQPRLVVLEGAHGAGRTQLARWFLETAAERGVALTWETRVDAEALDVAGLLRRCLRLGNGEPEAIPARLGALAPGLDPDQASRLAGLAGGRPAGPEDLPALAALLADLGREIPLALWMEGAPLAHPLVGPLVRRVLDGPGAVLVLLESTPGEHRAADERCEELLDLAPATAVVIEPLGPAELRELARELLPLEPALVDRLVDRAPVDADLVVATVGDLVRRDALREGSLGLTLRDGQDLAPPSRLIRAHVDRLEEVLEAAPPSTRDALASCAVAGSPVTPEAWQAVCEEVGVAQPSALLRSLLTSRLAELGAYRTWSFRHWSLALHLRHEALVDGRLPRLSRVATRHLRFDDVGRLGLALLDAGRPAEALEPLAEALRDALVRSDAGRALELCDALEAALRSEGIAEADPRWFGVRLSRSHLLRLQGRREAALALASRCGAQADASGDPRLRFQAWSLAAALQAEEGAEAEAAETLRRAQEAAHQLGDPRAQASVRLAMADSARRRGDLAEAAASYERELADPAGADDRRARAALLLGLGRVQAAAGALDRAERTLGEALGLSSASGELEEVAEARTALGRIAWRRGALEAADRWLAEARQALPPSDGARRARVVLSRCLVLASEGRWPAVLEEVERVLSQTPGLRADDRAWALALLVAARAPEPEEAWVAAAAPLGDLIRRTSLAEPELAMVLELGAARASRPDRAARCWALAAHLWRTLGDAEAARRAQARATGGEHG